MNNNEVMVQAVRTFHGEEGPKNPLSAPFSVSRTRFADLAANGLVIEVLDDASNAGAGEDQPANPDAAADQPVEPAAGTAETPGGAADAKAKSAKAAK